MTAIQRFLACLALAFCACVVVPGEEPWAPLELRLGPHAGGECWVYVDELYRGNFVDGSFRIYLTAGAHTVRVHGPGDRLWQREVMMPSPPAPMRLTVQPASGE
jgi:hypothetical protein